MAPLRTIRGAFFSYRREDGSLTDAQRGETVEIPEGDDLIRGDKFGAFMPETGQEPPAPVMTELVRPQLDWSDSEFDRYTDAAHVNELKDQFEVINVIDQPAVAGKILASEKRKNKPRAAVVEYLEGKLGVTEPAVTPTFMPDGSEGVPGVIPNPLAPPSTTEIATGPGAVPAADPDEDLVEYTKTSTVDDIVARAGSDRELAQLLLDAEGQGKNRKTAVDQLKAIVEA